MHHALKSQFYADAIRALEQGITHGPIEDRMSLGGNNFSGCNIAADVERATRERLLRGKKMAPLRVEGNSVPRFLLGGEWNVIFVCTAVGGVDE